MSNAVITTLTKPSRNLRQRIARLSALIAYGSPNLELLEELTANAFTLCAELSKVNVDPALIEAKHYLNIAFKCVTEAEDNAVVAGSGTAARVALEAVAKPAEADSGEALMAHDSQDLLPEAA